MSTLCSPSDASLTTSKVERALRSVYVGTLEYVLKIPLSVRGRGSEEERREKCIDYFLRVSPYASWEWIGGRLLCYEEDTALQAVKGHIKPNEGEYIGSTGIPIAMQLTREVYQQWCRNGGVGVDDLAMSWDRTGAVQYDVIRGYLEGLVSCSACYRLSEECIGGLCV